jgi:hypothetical protein
MSYKSHIVYARTEVDDEKVRLSKPLHERLIDEAAAEERRAENFRGCSFHGRWPGDAHLERASMLRAAALELMVKKRAGA